MSTGTRPTRHRLQLRRTGSGKRRIGHYAECSCRWRGRNRPTRSEALQDGAMHRLDVRHG